jgi:hypothetical protein
MKEQVNASYLSIEQRVLSTDHDRMAALVAAMVRCAHVASDAFWWDEARYMD